MAKKTPKNEHPESSAPPPAPPSMPGMGKGKRETMTLMPGNQAAADLLDRMAPGAGREGQPAFKLRALRQQRELLSRLRDDLAAHKDETKQAKLRVEEAQRDLERMVADSGQGELFPGKLVIDSKTGEVLDYQRPDLGPDPFLEGERKSEP